MHMVRIRVKGRVAQQLVSRHRHKHDLADWSMRGYDEPPLAF